MIRFQGFPKKNDYKRLSRLTLSFTMRSSEIFWSLDDLA